LDVIHCHDEDGSDLGEESNNQEEVGATRRNEGEEAKVEDNGRRSKESSPQPSAILPKRIEGYFPGAAYDLIKRTREKYMKRHLDILYDMFDTLSTMEVKNNSYDRLEIEQWCGALVRGLLEAGLPLHRASTQEIQHLSLSSFHGKLQSIFHEEMNLSDADLSGCDKFEWMGRIDNLPDGVDELPEEFEDHFRSQGNSC
jgi:hypothetical protein